MLKRVVVGAFLVLVFVAAEEPGKPDVNVLLRDLAVAQRDIRDIQSQCEVQIAALPQMKRLNELLGAARQACKEQGGKVLDERLDQCVDAPKAPKEKK